MMEALNLHKAEALRPQRRAGKRLTRGEAIKLFCLECMGYDGHRSEGTGTVTKGAAYQEVKKCTDPECPLFRYRLGSEEGEDRVMKLLRGEPTPQK